MNIFDKTPHQKKQIEVIDTIDQQVKNKKLSFSVIAPVPDFTNDSRICLTSVHLLHPQLIEAINKLILNPLKKIQPEHYYYSPRSLHATIKNVRTIADPPSFDQKDIQIVKKIFDEVIPKHHRFTVYFYRLLLFPNNLALMGTTDEALDQIILELDQKMKEKGIVDNKAYLNSRYFFCNITLARFITPINEKFQKKVTELSGQISKIFKSYVIDSVLLLSCNAVFEKKNIYGKWNLI